MKNFLDKLGNFQNKILNVIHVAGTNGKGSTIAFMRAILEAHDFSVNVFTSPHLVRMNERIRIKGKLITDTYYQEIDKTLAQYKEYTGLSIFEKHTVIALFVFYHNSADFTLLETGLGGRLDATNVIESPLLCILTAIDYDHREYLGNTLTEIAAEKAEIIKRNTILATDYQNAEVMTVIKTLAEQKQVKKSIIAGNSYCLAGNILTLRDNRVFDLKKLSLLGEHQYHNAALAISALSAIDSIGLDISKVKQALAQTAWPSRLQVVKELYNVPFKDEDEIILDGAHNSNGVMALWNYIKKFNTSHEVYIIFSMLKAKDLGSFIATIAKVQHHKIYAINFLHENSFSIIEIQERALKLGVKLNTALNVREALLQISKKSTHRDKKIFICGSLYLLGKILEDNQIIIE